MSGISWHENVKKELALGTRCPLSFLDQMSGISWHENVKKELALGRVGRRLAARGGKISNLWDRDHVAQGGAEAGVKLVAADGSGSGR